MDWVQVDADWYIPMLYVIFIVRFWVCLASICGIFELVEDMPGYGYSKLGLGFLVQRAKPEWHETERQGVPFKFEMSVIYIPFCWGCESTVHVLNPLPNL